MAMEHVHKSGRHTTFYLAEGDPSAPLVVFVHGWPELSRSWRHQLPAFASLGFRAVAPDLRGYGGSSVYGRQEDYALEEVVSDMVELLDGLERERAIWVGHDWGSPVVWSIASHHPERCAGVASLCVPYRTIECGFEHIVSLVDRGIYPEDRFPAGQWEYMLFYRENFPQAQQVFEANPYNTVKAFFRKGNPAERGKPAVTATTRIDGGFFGGLPEAPDVPRDPDVVTETDLHAYAAALSRNGFFGPDSYYMNHEANARYTESARNDGFLDMPALFLAAQYDFVCEAIDSRLPEQMRKYCRNLTERTIASGHWMAQERPREVNAALTHWLVQSVPEVWPGS